MGRIILFGLIGCLASSTLWGQVDNRRGITGAGNEFLSAGAFSISMGQYDEGIRLTELGLTQYQLSPAYRSVAESNLCAALAARGQAETAITHCTESLLLEGLNWRAYNNRAYAHYLLGELTEAILDIDSATVINAEASQVVQVRGLISELGLFPHVIMANEYGGQCFLRFMEGEQ